MDTRAPSATPAHPAPVGVAPGDPRLTLRAVVLGMAVGGCLSLCNIYSGLKIGFTTNMSIAAALLGYGIFHAARRVGIRGAAHGLGLQENVTNQTAASAAASIAGAGLVAPIPALTLLTGYEFDFATLVVWALSVSLLGVVVGIGIRRPLIEHQSLPFPYGIATATVMEEMYSAGREALRRLYVLLVAIGLASAVKVCIELLKLPVAWLGGSLSAGPLRMTAKNLGFGFDPSVLMVGVGALVGMRSAASMLGGALLGWLGLAPLCVGRGWVSVAGLDPDQMWFGPITGWLLWPGVALMVSSALTAFALSVPALIRALARASEEPHTPAATRSMSRIYAVAVGATGALCVTLQMILFDIGPVASVSAVVLSFGLAVVAGRVTGETGIAPIGAMGKVTQLIFAGIAPGNATANLMAANVTGGAASQCSDLLHDLKTGSLLDARPHHQAVAQVFGVLSGSLLGSAGYLALVPDPSRQLLTGEWPAPAVAQWKAVAEVFSAGAAHLPPGALPAMAVAGAIGAALAALSHFLPPERERWLPNPASVGLSFVLPAYYSISVFLGAAAALTLTRLRPGTRRFVVIAGAGLIAGESLSGVAFALQRLIAGG